jgi:phosphotriesterase-related protein
MNALTVLGTVPADDLDCTLMHEHLVFDFSCCLQEPQTAVEREMARQAVHVEVLGELRFNPLVVPDNLVQRDVQLAVKELGAYAAAGGRTIVDVSSVTIGRDPRALQKIARASGLNVIMGAGYYTQASLDGAFEGRSIDDVAEEIVSDVVNGVGDTGVRAGLIGEIGTSSPISPDEEKSLRASARAQAQTGAPLMVHPFPWGREGHRILDIVEEEGGNLQRTILCHMNASWFDVQYQTNLADRGAFLGYDMLGINHFYPPNMAAPGEIPAIEAVANLIELGYLDRLLLSQDVFLKMMLCTYGGHGYAHILANLAPLFQAAGVTTEHLDAMLVKNPVHLLAFV